MPAGPGTYGSQIGRPKKRQSGKKARKALAVQAASDSDLEEGKKKQATIAADKAMTAVGAHASSDPTSHRYQRSMSSVHNSPQNVRIRKADVKKARADRGRKKAWAWAQGQMKSHASHRKSVRNEAVATSIVDTYGNIATLFVETRSAASRRRTTARKEASERKKRDRTGKSMQAYGHGQRASKELATAKTYRSAADELTSHAKTNPGPNPSRRKDVTATAAQALRNTASRKFHAGHTQIKAGRQAAGNKRAVNRTLKRDETMGNLAKLSVKGK